VLGEDLEGGVDDLPGPFLGESAPLQVWVGRIGDLGVPCSNRLVS
jgi:hypothetical protein